MKMVRFVDSEIAYPSKCACCGQVASTTLEVRKEDLKRLALAAVASAAISQSGGPSSLASKLRSSRAVQVPYCAACAKHTKWSRMGGWLGVGLSLVVNAFFGALGGGVLVGILSVAAEDPKAGPSPEVVVGACVLLGVLIALAQVRLKPGALDRTHAAGDKDAVEIASFTATALVLKCHNNTFAADLLQANPGSAYGSAT